MSKIQIQHQGNSFATVVDYSEIIGECKQEVLLKVQAKCLDKAMNGSKCRAIVEKYIEMAKDANDDLLELCHESLEHSKRLCKEFDNWLVRRTWPAKVVKLDSAEEMVAVGIKVVDSPARSHPQRRKSPEPATVPAVLAGASVSTSRADGGESSQSFRDSITEISRQILLLQKPGETQNFLDELNDIPVSRICYMEMLVRGISNNNTESNLQDAQFLAVTALNSLLIRHHAADPIRNIPAFSMAIMNRIVNLLVNKNHDYGNSFGDQLAEDGPIVFKIRMKDKISRLKTLLTTDAQVKDESIEDTIRDIIGYCILFLHHTK